MPKAIQYLNNESIMTTGNQEPSRDNFGIALGSIQSDVKHLLSAISDSRTELRTLRVDMESRNSKMDERLVRLEQQHWKIVGWTGVAVVLFPVVVTILLRLWPWGV